MTANRTVALSLTLLLAGTTALQGMAGGPSAPASPSLPTVSAITAPATQPLDRRPEPVPAARSPHQQTMEAWALGRFQEAGLLLPPLGIHFHPHPKDCGGFPGYFAGQENAWSIEMCSPSPFVLLHELGHAWVAHNLTDAEREAFRMARRLPTWLDPAIPWHHRASEHAADLIAWGLSAEPPSLTTDPGDFDELARAFQALTGAEPLVEHPGPTKTVR